MTFGMRSLFAAKWATVLYTPFKNKFPVDLFIKPTYIYLCNMYIKLQWKRFKSLIIVISLRNDMKFPHECNLYEIFHMSVQHVFAQKSNSNESRFNMSVFYVHRYVYVVESKSILSLLASK